MQMAYLIVAHKNPKLLKLFIDALSSEQSAFFIHIDEKSDIRPFRIVTGENVHFTNRRIPVYWGEFSMVEAILTLLEQALAAPKVYDRFILLTGSDYPLRSKDYIHNFFEKNRLFEYMSMVKMPNKGKPLSRITVYRVPSDQPVVQLLVKVLAKLGLAKRDYRRHLGGLEPYAGSTSWALTRDACRYILDYIRTNPSLCRFFKNTAVSDEILFPTILGNSLFAAHIKRNLLFDDWGKQSSHPEMINEKHVQGFKSAENVVFSDMYGAGEMLFARKFSDENLEIIAQVDDMIRQKDHPLVVSPKEKE